MGKCTRLLVVLLAWGLIQTDAENTAANSAPECGEWMTTPRSDGKSAWKPTKCTKTIYIEASTDEEAIRVCERAFAFDVTSAKPDKSSILCNYQLNVVCKPNEFPLYDLCLSNRPEISFAELPSDCKLPVVFGMQHLKFLTRFLEINKIGFAFIAPTSFRNIPPMYKTPKTTFKDAKDGEMILLDKDGSLWKEKGSLDSHEMFVVRGGYDSQYGLRRGGTEPVTMDFRATPVCVRNGKVVSDKKREAENWNNHYPMIYAGDRTVAASSRLYTATYENVHKLNEICYNIWKSFMDGAWTPKSALEAKKLSSDLTKYPARLALKRRNAGKQSANPTCGGNGLMDEKKFYSYTDRKGSFMNLKPDDEFWSDSDPRNDCSDGEEGASTAGINNNRISSILALQRSPIICQHGSNVKVGELEETCANALCDPTNGICDDSSGKPVCKCKNNYQPSKAIQTETLLPEGYICSPCPRMQADIVILVDHSGSVRDENAKKQNAFIETFINSFTIARDQTRIAIIRFSTVEQTEFVMRFADCETTKDAQKCVKEKLASKPYDAGLATCHDTAYRFAFEEIRDHGDASKNRAIIMITDGEYGCDDDNEGGIPQIMTDIRNTAPSRQTTFYAVRVQGTVYGEDGAKAALSRMVEGKAQNLLKVDDFSQLSASLITQLQRAVCG